MKNSLPQYLHLFLSVIIFSFPSFEVNASLERASQIYDQTQGKTQHYPRIARELIEEKLFSSALPFIKEYLREYSRSNPAEIDELVDRVIPYVGVRQFETMSQDILARSKSPVLRYVLAKKFFRQGKYDLALAELGDVIPRKHPAKPFALLLEATILSLNNKLMQSNALFKECVETAESSLGHEDEPHRIRQLTIAKDYCIIGVPRNDFATRNYESAVLGYLDLPKSSYVWPEILFEEAWSSFYLRDYNRALGKLVTYKAPLLNWYFNPETDVLRALTYLELCLWSDAQKVVDEFYSKYEKQSSNLSAFLEKNAKEYRYYYSLANNIVSGGVFENDLVTLVIKNILRDPTFIELWQSMQKGREEAELIKRVRHQGFKQFLATNLNETLNSERDLIGAYIRKGLWNFNQQILDSFEGMSNIKLEVLAKRKNEILALDENSERRRGDIRYLKRNDKQYFWDFNGEFWADELGDYAFALKSECQK